MEEAVPIARPREEDEDRRAVLHDYWSAIGRRKWLIIEAFAVVVLGTVIATGLMPREYTAHASVIIRNPPSLLGTRERTGIIPEPPSIATRVREVLSMATCEEAARRLAEEDGINLTALQVRDAIEATVPAETEIIRISATAADPWHAQQIAQRVAEAFVDRTKERDTKDLETATREISAAVKSAKKELDKAEKAVLDFKKKHKIVSMSAETSAAVGRAQQFKTQVVQQDVALEEIETRLADIRSRLEAQNARLQSPETMRSSEVVSQLKAQLVSLEVELADAKAKYTRAFPRKIADIEQRISDTKARLSREIENLVTDEGGSLGAQDSLYQALINTETELAAQQARRAALQRLADKYEAELKKIPETEVELAKLERDRQAAENIYFMLKERLAQAAIDEKVQAGSADLLDYAFRPRRYSKPNWALNVSMAILCGLLLGFVAAFVAEYLEDTIRKAEEVQSTTGLRSLGIIPMFDEGEGPLVVTHGPGSVSGEAFRALRANLLARAGDAKCFAIASAGLGEGKSTIAANLAVALAHQGKRVLLVDSDLRRPVLHELFGVDNAFGLTDYLGSDDGLERYVSPTDVPGLSLLTSGPPADSPTELLGSDPMDRLISEARDSFDFALFDTPPCLPVTDASVVSSKVDATIMVVGIGDIGRDAVRRAKEALIGVGAKLFGVVIAKASPADVPVYRDYYARAPTPSEPPEEPLPPVEEEAPGPGEREDLF